MYQSGELELWNLTPHVPVWLGAQDIFNIVGRLRSPDETTNLLYSLNGGPERPVYFERATKQSERLERPGDFNIDTITAQDLKANNSLALRAINGASEGKRYGIEFPSYSYTESSPHFKLNLEEIGYPEQVGQVVDGKWRVSRDESGEACLEVAREDAGYDRIILFGCRNWTSGYQITARICVTAWTGIASHGIGVAFKWNPHVQGDGTCLPSQWNTGLGMYYSGGESLRLAFGVTVNNAQGAKFHHHLLQHRPLYPWRKKLTRVCHRVLGMNHLFPQIPSKRQYCFRMLVRPEKYALTVWRRGEKEPAPQLALEQPVDRLPRGSVGIIAHHCAVRVYDLEASPV